MSNTNLLIEDLNGDGLLDIIYHEVNGKRDTWQQNLGEGLFAEETILTEKGTKELSVFDVDGDGDGDLLFGDNIYYSPNNKDSLLFWQENMGMGVFSGKKLIDSLSNIRAIYPLDIDNRNGLDILAITDSSIYWYKNDGAGNFLKQEEFPDWINNTKFKKSGGISIASANFDEDTNEDLLFYDIDTYSLVSYKNKGNGNFTINIIYEELLSRISGIEVVDIDNNQYNDIITFQGEQKEVIGFMNNGTTSVFEPKVLITDSIGVHSVATGDLNKDGLIDIIVSSHDKTISWYQNGGNGNFFKQPINADLESSPTIVAIIDLDGDEENDIVWRLEGTISWSKNKGLGRSFEHRTIDTFGGTVSYTINGFEVRNIIVTDFNGDSNLDLVAISNGGNDIFWYKNDGQGNFNTKRSELEDINYIVGFSSIDVNGDSCSEIMVSGENGTIFLIKYKERGAPSIKRLPSSIPDVYTISQLQAIDLDKDGDRDIVTSISNDVLGLYWLENDGLGNFTENWTPTSSTTIENKFRDSWIADLNKDGYQDLIAIPTIRAKIIWFENRFNLSSISGTTFWDVNANGQLDETEKGISYLPLSINPSAAAAYTNSEGEYRFFLTNDTYTVRADSTDCWELTSDNSYTIPINNNSPTGYNFGFQLVSNEVASDVRGNSPTTRCGFSTPFWLTMINTGCQPIHGKLGVILDSLVTFVTANEAPSEVRGDTLLWNYEELLAGQKKQIRLTLEIAGPDHIGEIINITTLSYIENEQKELVLTNIAPYQSEIRCAYDPNDKITHPNRSLKYDQNYTLFEEDLEYTIRFQNTGNDTAFTVVIKDQLDKNLDWTSFKPLTASHPHETLLRKDGLVEFSFRNILLPDSTTNEIASHGFVTYTIATKKDLPEQTAIENTAGIFFDFNPPIITNTTSNVLVSELPKQLVSTQDIVALQKIKVYPNPFGDYIIFEQLDLSPTENLTLILFDGTGRQVKAKQMKKVIHQLAVTDLIPGIFFYQIINTSGELIASGKVVKSRL